jgi:hypothetical protein
MNLGFSNILTKILQKISVRFTKYMLYLRSVFCFLVCLFVLEGGCWRWNSGPHEHCARTPPLRHALAWTPRVWLSPVQVLYLIRTLETLQCCQEFVLLANLESVLLLSRRQILFLFMYLDTRSIIILNESERKEGCWESFLKRLI